MQTNPAQEEQDRALFLIKGETVRALINYLAQRPWIEVQAIMPVLAQLARAEEERNG